MSRIAELERLHTADPRDADVMYMLGHEHMKSGEFARAVEWFDRCLAADRAYVYAYYHKARAQQASGDPASASATLRAGLEHATMAGNAKASGEIMALLEQLED